MKIGIDCRLYGPKHTGIGRYVQNLVENLLALDSENEYVLFTNKTLGKEFENLKPKIEFVDIDHYSLREQILFPKLIKREKIDLMHFPHFNVPVFYKGKYVVTIHDLIKHSSKGSGTTTKSPLLYWLKYLGYKFVFKKSVERAEKIITPSQFVKNQLVKEYKLNTDKVAVTYEGIDTKLKTQNSTLKTPTQNSKLLEHYKINKPFLLYVGSVYPHKNVERLIESVKRLQAVDYKLQLVIVCARNVFIQRLSKYVDQNKAGEFVNLAGFVPDEELAILYQEAAAFVFPTLSEGFGLPGLEAMSLGCPVICSDIPVLREVYKEAAVYFNPLDTNDISEKISFLIKNKELQEKLKKSGVNLVKTYSWQKTAQETLKVYKAIC